MTKPIAVCVPVRNEAERLPRFLDAIAAQGMAGLTLCILLDGCTDASAAIVTARAPQLPFPVRVRSIAGGDANAGRARRVAMALGQEVLGGAGTIVSTDADSVPAPGWLAANLAGLAHADVVAGRIVRRAWIAMPLQDRIEAYYDRLFALRRLLDPVAWEAPRTHHYTSGASLAFRAHAYAALGGFEGVAAAEDARIVDAAHRAGLRVRRDAAVTVETSSRREGRARGGLADHLRALDRGAAAPTMAHPHDAAWRYRMHAAARRAFGHESAGLSERLSRVPSEVAAIAKAAPNAEAFAMCVVPERPGGERTVSLDVAEDALAALETDLARQAA
ncbi:glycosyltransferase [Sphingomonas sp.]|uniref:glycosyltransferase n=1 Tax=Sphingomonas sp. TaxID=28214 RepID=UPI0035BC4629